MYKKEEGRLVIPPTVYPEPHELSTAEYLVSLGKRVTFIAPVRTKGIRTPDIFMDGVYWEMKSPTKSGRWIIENILKKAVQKSDSVVLDIHRTSTPYVRVYKDCERQFYKLKRLRRLLVVDSGGRYEPLVFKKK